MSALADTIEAHVDAIVERFAARLYGASAAASLPFDDVVDSAADFLGELVRTLRSVPGPEPGAAFTRALRSQAATAHGRQRFLLGYEIGATLREYGALRDLLFQIVEEAGLRPTFSELRLVATFFSNAMGDAATEYGIAREERLREQAARHLGFLAHELRDPVSSALLALELGRQTGELKDGAAAQAVERGLRRLSSLVDDALVEVRLRGQQAPDLRPVSLRALAQTLVDDVAPLLRARQHRLEIDVDDASVIADEKLLRSALSNLLRNGIKFSREGGTLHLRARAAEGRATFEVEDACGGLPPGAVEKMFDPYVQLGRDRSGFGLGLAIARNVAEAHDGELRVHDLSPHGCVFLLEPPLVPVRRDEAGPAGARPPPPPRRG